MLCEHCHKEVATVFLTQVINNKKVEMHLCSRCAKEQENLLYSYNPSIQQFMSGLMKNSKEETEAEQKVLFCTKCNMTLDEFRKKSKLGCDHCYQAFEPYLKHILKSVHGSTEHTGKRPLRSNKGILLQEKLEDLESQLRLALMQEDYIAAAKIRDEIKKLKEEA
ncbi:MAG: hypothetical protein JW708_11915 [Vallitaleaceae bacterium]|nr:hypothetical protein [Vallitaleaceae bacterium]